jgi:hypothetical protein
MIPLRLGKKPHKYKAKPMKLDGVRFASTAEAKYYAELLIRERAGEIDSITIQPKFDIDILGTHVCSVLADFMFFDKTEERMHHVDVKGMDTALSRLKRKLVLACHGIGIEVIKRRKR